MTEAPATPAQPRPKISVVVLNYNGQTWLPRCFESLERQTIFRQIEIIVTDNASQDGSDRFAAEWLAARQAGKVVQNGANLMYCGANNNGAAAAGGEFFLFLNNDTWLEPDCLEKLYDEVTRVGADAATPKVLDYDDDEFQGCGSPGLDWCGLPALMETRPEETTEVFAACGCSLLVRAETFRRIGGFAPELLIYADESDLSWRVWIAGGKVVTVPSSRLHHRGAAVVNPEGRTKAVELRTSETKRYLANRNGILFILKNSQHVLLLLLVPHLLMLVAEMLVSLLLVRRWNYVRKSYLQAFRDALFGMWPHIREWRRRIAGLRVRGDFWMIRRFWHWKPSRWAEVKLLFKWGLPKVDAR